VPEIEIEAWTDGVESEAWFDPNNPWTPLEGVRTGAELTRGERAADIVRNKMGSWGFVAMFTMFMLAWALTNSVVMANRGFDPYPYILLNLLLSTLAGLQGAILLIAAKRADAVAAEQALSHLTISKGSSEIIKEIRSEMRVLHQLVRELHHANEKERKSHD